MTSIRRSIAGLTLGCLFIECGLAQSGPAGSWEGLAQIPARTEVRVYEAAGLEVRGKFRSATADSIVLLGPGGQQSLDRKTVVRVLVKRRSHRLRNTLLGAAVGFGGGLGLGMIVEKLKKPSFWNLGLDGLAIWALGTLLGPIVGLLIPTGGWREAYSAPAP